MCYYQLTGFPLFLWYVPGWVPLVAYPFVLRLCWFQLLIAWIWIIVIHDSQNIKYQNNHSIYYADSMHTLTSLLELIWEQGCISNILLLYCPKQTPMDVYSSSKKTWHGGLHGEWMVHASAHPGSKVALQICQGLLASSFCLCFAFTGVWHASWQCGFV